MASDPRQALPALPVGRGRRNVMKRFGVARRQIRSSSRSKPRIIARVETNMRDQRLRFRAAPRRWDRGRDNSDFGRDEHRITVIDEVTMFDDAPSSLHRRAMTFSFRLSKTAIPVYPQNDQSLLSPSKAASETMRW